MSSVPGEALFGRKRSLAGSPKAGHGHLEDAAGQDGRLLMYVWASGGGQALLDPDEKVLNHPRPHPSSKTM